VLEKSGAAARTRNRVRYRLGIFTRFILLLGVLAYSLLPLLASWPAIHARKLTFENWQVVCLEAVILQAALWLAAKRCGYEGLSFWDGASLVAGSMRSGWVYIDMFIGGFSVFCFLIISVFIALFPKPQSLYYRLVRLFVRNRLLQ
jgi:hypothetical protein